MDDRRHIILSACERLLHRYGPQKTTMADIAREAHVAVGSVYLEFDSKETILEELSRKKHATVLEAMRLAVVVERPWAERLRAAIDARTDTFLEIADDGVHGSDLVHCSNGAVQGAHEQYKRDELALIAELLRDGAKAEELDVAKPEVTAKAVLVAYARFSPPWLFHAPREETRTLLRAVHDVVLYGLVRRKRR